MRRVLEQYPCTLFSPCKSTLCAYFDAGKPHTAAFRADMDALPIAERSSCDYVSVMKERCTPAATTATWPWFWRWQAG